MTTCRVAFGAKGMLYKLDCFYFVGWSQRQHQTINSHLLETLVIADAERKRPVDEDSSTRNLLPLRLQIIPMVATDNAA